MRKHRLIGGNTRSQVVLLAHDWGAVIAWQLAMHRSHCLDRLVIMNVPHPACMRREIRNNPEQRRSSWYVLFFQLPWLPELLLSRDQGEPVARLFRTTSVHPENFSEDDLAVYRNNAASPSRVRGMVNYYRALLRGGMRRMDALGTPIIDVPTLLLWGEQDSALTKPTTYGIESRVRNLTLRYLPQASHWVQQDAPEEVNAMLSAWLAGAEVPHAQGVTALTGDIG